MTSASTSRVKLVTTFSQFDSALADSNSLVMILYTAPGCPHCNRFLPSFNSISTESGMTSVSFYNVNIMSGDGLGIARRSNVSGVPHTTFFSRGRKIGGMQGDNADEFRKLIVKYKTERGFVGSGHTLGSSASTPPRAMGDSRDTNADHLERKAPPPELVHKLMGMGFPRDRAIAALQRTKNDADTAADMLLGGGSAEDRMWLHGGGAPMAPRAPTARCGIGLGLADHWDNAGPRVADILPYSPAAECMAFTKGDKIVGIDGVNVKGLGVDAIKPMILGPPGSTIKISFVPCPTRAWSASPFSSADPFRMAERPITVTLIRTVRREAAQDEADAEAEAAEAPWYTTWWKGVQKGAAKTSKNVEDSLVEAGEKLGEAGTAIGRTAKAGWDGTTKVAAKAGKSVQEGTKAAGEKLSEAGAVVREAVVVDTLARKRLAELEAENRLLRDKLERQTLLEEAQVAQARAAEIVEGGGYSSIRTPVSSPAAPGTRGRGTTEVSVVGGWESCQVLREEGGGLISAPSTDSEWCQIRVRLTDGSIVEQRFRSSQTLLEILEVAVPSECERREATLMTACPRIIFAAEELSSTLRECGLVPAATLVVTRRP